MTTSAPFFRWAVPILTFAAVIGSRPSAAHADGLITPFFGYDFGGDAGDCRTVSRSCSSKQWAYGVGIGFMVGGVVGFEGEFAMAPDFFGNSPERSDNYVMSLMGNVIAGVPIGPIRPYATGGFGLLHTDVSRSPIGAYNAFSNNSFSLNVGGGLMALFARHVGVRGDLRYVRTLQDLTFPALELDSKDLEFWRGSIGLVLRF
jgi:opacity protein-like surface antigen